jgi:hypothetical protein
MSGPPSYARCHNTVKKKFLARVLHFTCEITLAASAKYEAE